MSIVEIVRNMDYQNYINLNNTGINKRLNGSIFRIAKSKNLLLRKIDIQA